MTEAPEIRFAQLIHKQFGVDITEGVTDVATRKERARQVLSIGQQASMQATKTQTFGAIFKGIYGEGII